MTNDLVKRLRKRQEFESIDGYKRVEWEDEDALEAADRIELLEAALRYYAKGYENPFGGDDSLIARKALEGKND